MLNRILWSHWDFNEWKPTVFQKIPSVCRPTGQWLILTVLIGTPTESQLFRERHAAVTDFNHICGALQAQESSQGPRYFSTVSIQKSLHSECLHVRLLVWIYVLRTNRYLILIGPSLSEDKDKEGNQFIDWSTSDSGPSHARGSALNMHEWIDWITWVCYSELEKFNLEWFQSDNSDMSTSAGFIKIDIVSSWKHNDQTAH